MNIVERLRAMAEGEARSGIGRQRHDLFDEAAAEIERLETALKAMRQALDEFPKDLTELVEEIDSFLNDDDDKRSMGFVLVTFHKPPRDGLCNFISNVPRDLSMALLRDQLERYDAQLP